MTSYQQLSPEELIALKASLEQEYNAHKAKNLALNMARGKPSSAQLDLSNEMLTCISTTQEAQSSQGDCRNYGILEGITEARELMAFMLDDEPENVIVYGNSSLNLMYDSIARMWIFGSLGSKPWSSLDKVSWLCPCPGYDRHFAITQEFGINMIPIPLNDHGPDMDMVEELVANDASIKGIWCVPQYSNPSGITYSDDVVKRLARMSCAAEDFKIFWDNAYVIHHLSTDPAKQDHVLDIAKECKKANHPHRALKFASTSKVTFPGAGISAIAASDEMIAEIKQRMGIQTIGHDKLNQLRHVRFFKNPEGLMQHMYKHAEILAPKFDLVDTKLREQLDGLGLARWTKPRGGYFISLDMIPGCAKRAIALAREAGVIMTGAGATYPLKNDTEDANVRIAPTLPPLEELDQAMDVFCTCIKLAAVEKLLV